MQWFTSLPGREFPQAACAEFAADDPMLEGALWTNLSRCEISRRLAELGTSAGCRTDRKLIKATWFRTA
jgi:hypothetical protein